ncbi:MAG: signal peptide peptidase SppA [Crocinitomicaceae bacterium]
MTESVKKISFGRIFWPTFLAALVVSILGLFIWLMVIFGIIGSLDSTGVYTVKNNSILHMRLDGEIGERGKTKLDPMNFMVSKKIGLSEILYGLKTAEADEKIKGVFLELENVSCGLSTAGEIRNAINDFEKSGKFVVAYNSGEVVTRTEYYISSAANELYGFPNSNVTFLGLGSELMFLKGTLDKMDVEMQIIRGSNNDFKSAVEPYFLESMSDSSRLQMTTLVDNLWSDMREDIAVDRSLTPEFLDSIAENALVIDVTDAVEQNLMDKAIYRDEVLDMLAEKVQEKNVEDLKMTEFSKYAKKKFYQNQVLTENNNPNIAVILAEGGVSTSGDGLTSDEICKLFREVRNDKTIKTVVFRVNSPGGSALASDQIWREVELTNKKKKVIVSMGDVAASGGYYVAASAHKIFAEPTTITGSIGVFGVIPYTGKMLENKLGVTFDRVATNKHAVMTTNRKLDDEEMLMIQDNVDEIYSEFKALVAKGRKLSPEQVEVIARGRVWTGRDAQKIGLVDELGGITEAIDYASKEANIEEKKILFYPAVKEDKLGELLEEIENQSNAGISIQSSPQLPKELLKTYDKLKTLENYTGIQMRMPFDINFL